MHVDWSATQIQKLIEKSLYLTFHKLSTKHKVLTFQHQRTLLFIIIHKITIIYTFFFLAVYYNKAHHFTIFHFYNHTKNDASNKIYGLEEESNPPDFFKIAIVPKTINPITWPPIAARNTPPLNDITANITKYENPVRTPYSPVLKSEPTTSFDVPGLSLTMLVNESHSTNNDITNTRISANAYMAALSPGQQWNSMSTLWPQ